MHFVLAFLSLHFYCKSSWMSQSITRVYLQLRLPLCSFRLDFPCRFWYTYFLMNLKLTISQLVHLHYHCHVGLSYHVLALDSIENRYSYSKWTPGSPCKYFVHPDLRPALIKLSVACTANSNCSSAKVAGLVFYETFSFLWTSQVIGNVSLATLAGGPYGAWYYFGPSDLGIMVWFLSFYLTLFKTKFNSLSTQPYLHLSERRLCLLDPLLLVHWLSRFWSC